MIEATKEPEKNGYLAPFQERGRLMEPNLAELLDEGCSEYCARQGVAWASWSTTSAKQLPRATGRAGKAGRGEVPGGHRVPERSTWFGQGPATGTLLFTPTY